MLQCKVYLLPAFVYNSRLLTPKVYLDVIKDNYSSIINNVNNIGNVNTINNTRALFMFLRENSGSVSFLSGRKKVSLFFRIVKLDSGQLLTPAKCVKLAS